MIEFILKPNQNWNFILLKFFKIHFYLNLLDEQMAFNT